ncbi:NAD(P)-dependent oxidoreductase [Rodentibacter trehalosifermentans]|uniref:NAD(P)-dependent oxidoreductase n=1 Tax=Rodentibacter trehalosifermentans TaxID=1908263 RepID=A0A1V3IY22_9PAST|nr:SDR family oxidoreductase [Rodentibacter trehalosifermentans]OOF47041.1 NAD(P)-dependent oxidoreductase [Rodentibacter trehalosifermentans]
MTNKTIAITGATGQFGAIALDLLKTKNANVIALVRSLEKISGVEARKFDYSKTEGQTEALSGVDTLILVSSNEIGQRLVQHKNAIESAKKAGVKHIIYTSLLGATNDNTVKSLASEHVETEAALKSSGITYTILRNGWYTENYTGSISAALANNAFYGSAKNGKISSALRAELAEAAVNVALGEGHDNQTYELVGSTSWTLADLAAEISKQSGKEIPYVDVPAADYAAALVQAGLDAGFAGLIAEWDVDASNGALFSEDKTLEKLLGRPTAGLDVAVKQAL